MTTDEYAGFRARVARELACDHDPRIRERVNGDGRVQCVKQCWRCGKFLGAVKREPGYLEPFDEAACRRRTAYESAVWQREMEDEKLREREAWLAEHAAYLRTAQWARLRAAVLRRAQGLCEGCRQRAATQVHHLHYRSWQREMLFDLVAVCDSCHRQIHDREVNDA